MEEIRLLVVVREGDFAAFQGVFGSRFVYGMKRMHEFSSSSECESSSGEGRWLELDRIGYEKSIEIRVPQDLQIGELQDVAMAAARAQNLVYRDPGPEKLSGNSIIVTFSSIVEVWLTDVTSERLPRNATVRMVGLDDGDVIVLCVKHTSTAQYLLGPVPDPESLFRSLLLGSRSASPTGLPRIWGILLYTDSDVEMATYVREQFDELNALSGLLFRVFVLERPQNWRVAKRYWRGKLEPSLYRTFGALQWLKWKPYERYRAYDIARELGIAPNLLPCLVLLRSVGGTSRITFPITEAPGPYLRRLFGEIVATLGATPEPYSISRASSPIYSVTFDLGDTVKAGPADADRRAFDRVAAAEERIKQALVPRPLSSNPDVGTTYVFNGNATVLSEGRAMSDNFNFYGQTTFINRPVDAVIQDFQNAYSPAVGYEDLSRLLRLVLSSKDLSDSSKEEVAATIHEVAENLGKADYDKQEIRTRLEALRAAIGRAADIAAPAMEIISAVLSFLHH